MKKPQNIALVERLELMLRRNSNYSEQGGCGPCVRWG